MQVIFIITLFVLFFFFLFYPETVFFASKSALDLWGHTVVPSMLPFFILNNMITAAGGVSLFGRIWQRPIRRILKLPGEAAFVLATGYTAGVPVSATIISSLRQKEILTKSQGERLLAFAANVSPGFLLSAVGVAMLGREEAGFFLIAVHYGTNLTLMLICSLFAKKENAQFRQNTFAPKTATLSRSKIITEAAEKSISSILLIGGIILIFRILCDIIEELRLMETICDLLSLNAETEQILIALCRGTLEITTGAESISAFQGEFPFSLCVSLLSAIFAFGGISAVMQIASQIKETDLSLRFYLKYKIIQGVTAFTVSLLLFDKVTEPSAAVWLAQTAQNTPCNADMSIFPWYGVYVIFLISTVIIQRLFCED